MTISFVGKLTKKWISTFVFLIHDSDWFIRYDQLLGKVESWDLPPLPDRYKTACKALGTCMIFHLLLLSCILSTLQSNWMLFLFNFPVVYGNVKTLLQKCQTTHELILSELSLGVNNMRPVFRAIQHHNYLQCLVCIEVLISKVEFLWFQILRLFRLDSYEVFYLCAVLMLTVKMWTEMHYCLTSWINPLNAEFPKLIWPSPWTPEQKSERNQFWAEHAANININIVNNNIYGRFQAMGLHMC